MTLRRASASDLSAIRDLRVQAAHWLLERGIAQWDPESFTDDHTRADFEEHRLYVLCDGAAPVGTFRLQTSDPAFWPEASPGEALYLHCLVVARERAGEGIGTLLLHEAGKIAATEGYVSLRLDCWAKNIWLRRYYESQGFIFCGEHAEESWAVARFERATR